MKRIVAFVLVMVMMIGLMPPQSHMVMAAEETETVEVYEAPTETALELFQYQIDAAEKTVMLTKYIGSEAVVAVPGVYTVDGIEYEVVLQSGTVFYGNTTITSVTIGSGVRFADATMQKLFAGCSKLTTVDMTGVDTSYVTSLRELFSLCKNLTTVYGYQDWDTSKVESIYKTFNQVQKMTTIDLSRWELSQVKNSGWCFQSCYVQELLLPEDLTVISSGFLNHTSQVTGSTFTIPSGVQKIGYGHTIYDFATDDFVEFIVAEGNNEYKTIDGILYTMDGTEMLAIPRNKAFENGVYEIPEGVSFLGELSFSRNYNIETLILPDSYVIEYIEPYDDRYVVFEDIGNLNIGTNLTIAIYCYTGIRDYVVKDTNPNYTSVDGIIYSKDMTSVVAIPTRYGRLIEIPEGVTTWEIQALWDDKEVDDQYALSMTVDKLVAACGGVSLPSTLVEIEEEQFGMLNRLKTKFQDDFVITVAEDNPVYYVDENGYLVKRPLCILKQPDSVESKVGTRFTIAVEAKGENLTYQWYYKDAGMKNFGVSSNQTSAYSYIMQTYMNHRQVYCVVTDANGNQVTTDVATITRPPMELKILAQPQDVQAELAEVFSIKPMVQGEGLTYQWYYKENYMKNFGVSSNKTAAYSYSMQSYMKGRQVYCVITDQHGNQVTTDVVTINLPPAELKLLQQPTDVYAAKGEKFAITFKAEGDGLNYQWYYKEGYSKTFAPSSNKTASYSYAMQSYMNNRQVYCVITDRYGNQVTTDTVTIHVNQ